MPQFFYKKDVIPGRINEFDVIVTEPGTYGGQCAEFCGLGHADMLFTVQAMSQARLRRLGDSAAAGAAEPASVAPPSGAPTISRLGASASTAGFDQSTLTAPANQPIAFDFTNADPAASPTMCRSREANPDGTDWIGMPFANAGQKATYSARRSPPAPTEFYCAVHPTT